MEFSTGYLLISALLWGRHTRSLNHTPLLCHCLRCVGTLAGNNRLTRTLGVIRAYATIMSAHRGEVPCTVTTAKVRSLGKVLQLWGISKVIPHWLVLQPLDTKSRSELEGVLKGFLESKQVLKLFLKVCYLWEADDLMLKLSHVSSDGSLHHWWYGGGSRRQVHRHDNSNKD